MATEGRRKNLRQYVVYLNKNLDRDIIDHLEPLLDERRANEEIRRLLHAGLRGPVNYVARPQFAPEEYLEGDTTVSMPAATSAKEKARRTFGSFED
jgi:hypothetical protein